MFQLWVTYVTVWVCSLFWSYAWLVLWHIATFLGWKHLRNIICVLNRTIQTRPKKYLSLSSHYHRDATELRGASDSLITLCVFIWSDPLCYHKKQVEPFSMWSIDQRSFGAFTVTWNEVDKCSNFGNVHRSGTHSSTNGNARRGTVPISLFSCYFSKCNQTLTTEVADHKTTRTSHFGSCW